MLSVVILVDDDKVGKADEMAMMYESDASCTSYTACYITTSGLEQILTIVSLKLESVWFSNNRYLTTI